MYGCGTLWVASDTYPVVHYMTDRELWDSARSGNAQSFGVLYERHAKAIYNYCFRRCGDWATAEDLTSVVFLEAWRRRNTDLQRDSALPWLYGVATNVTRSQWRSLKRFRSALDRVPAPLDVPDHADSVVDREADEVHMRQVLTAVRKLPRREQDVLALVVWEGLTYEDAALALGVPVGTIRSRLSRGRSGLGELISQSGHQPIRGTDLKPREEQS